MSSGKWRPSWLVLNVSIDPPAAGQEDDNITRHLVNSLLAKQTVYIRPGIQTDSPVDVTVTLDLVDISEVVRTTYYQSSVLVYPSICDWNCQ